MDTDSVSKHADSPARLVRSSQVSQTELVLQNHDHSAVAPIGSVRGSLHAAGLCGSRLDRVHGLCRSAAPGSAWATRGSGCPGLRSGCS